MVNIIPIKFTVNFKNALPSGSSLFGIKTVMYNTKIMRSMNLKRQFWWLKKILFGNIWKKGSVWLILILDIVIDFIIIILWIDQNDQNVIFAFNWALYTCMTIKIYLFFFIILWDNYTSWVILKNNVIKSRLKL